MLRTIGEVIKRPDGQYKVRLSCGHMHSVVLVEYPAMTKVYNCQRCDLKGQGTRAAGIGYLNNGLRRKGHD